MKGLRQQTFRGDFRGSFRGFTLIELLVVMSVIALLVALLLPTLAEARRSSQDAACLVNVRSMGQAAFMYANDYAGSLVPQVIDPTNFNYTPLASENRIMGTHRWAYWADALFAYMTDEKVFDCPLGSYRFKIRQPWGYAVNPFMYPVDSLGAQISPLRLRKLDEFKKPFNKLHFMDSGFSISASATPSEHFSPYIAQSYSVSTGNRSSPAIRHNLRRDPQLAASQMPSDDCGFNAIFMDGHGSYVDWPTVVPRYFGGGSATAEDRAKRDFYWLP